jgi:hypothetical protein
MAYYRFAEHLKQSSDVAFDVTHSPGDRVTYSGIYRCEGCGREISHNANVSLPSQNQDQHNYSKGAVRWKLIVRAET